MTKISKAERNYVYFMLILYQADPRRDYEASLSTSFSNTEVSEIYFIFGNKKLRRTMGSGALCRLIESSFLQQFLENFLESRSNKV
jgi:hypothetical protein